MNFCTISDDEISQSEVIIDISLILCLDIEHYPNKSDRFLVRTAFLEIYNEKISDLMVGITCFLKKGQN